MSRSNLTYGQTSLSATICSAFMHVPFTGKEKDAESGYHYFGARYYDADLLMGWLSVDPVSDNYPSLSPYNYCAWNRPTGGHEHRLIKSNLVNNPVKLVDLDGEEVEYASFSDRIIVAAERIFRSEFRIRFNDLKKSTETYVFKGYFNRKKNGGEVTTNGEKIFVNYNRTYKKDQGTGVFAHLRHETEHAVQFEYGEVGFDKGSSSTWESSTINFDITDETKARDFGYSIGPFGLLQSSKHERTFRDD